MPVRGIVLVLPGRSKLQPPWPAIECVGGSLGHGCGQLQPGRSPVGSARATSALLTLVPACSYVMDFGGAHVCVVSLQPVRGHLGATWAREAHGTMGTVFPSREFMKTNMSSVAKEWGIFHSK